MATKIPNSGFQHSLPYFVLAALIVVAVVGTKILSSLSSRQNPDAKTSIAPAKKQTNEPAKPEEPVLALRLPDKSHIGTVGKDTPLQAVIFGREADLLKIIGNSKIPITLDFGDTEKPQTSDPKELLARLQGFQQSDDPSLSYKVTPAPGHVVVVVKGQRQFLELTTLIRMDAKKPPEKRLFATTAMDPKDPGCKLEGTMCIDSKGVISVSIGCEDGVELEASSSGEFQVTIPEGGTRFSVSSKG